MIENIERKTIYLACGVTDMRKSINGLSIIVREKFELNLFEEALFIFCNRKKDKIKILNWDRNGFWIHYKKLEKGHFNWPGEGTELTMNMTYEEIRWLLNGPAVEQKVKRKEVFERVAI